MSPAAMKDKRQTRQARLRLLAIESHAGKAGWLVDGVIQADPSAGERGQARSALLKLLADCDHAHNAARLARRMTRLGPTAEEERQTREALLRLLAGPIEGPPAVQLANCVSRSGSSRCQHGALKVGVAGGQLVRWPQAVTMGAPIMVRVWSSSAASASSRSAWLAPCWWM